MPLRNYAIVLLSYNHPDLTSKAVESILNTEFNPNQLYLIHNGSLEKHIEVLKNRFQSIRHIILNENKGFSGGANAGLKTAFQQTEYVFFLTNDTEIISRPDHLSEDLDIISPVIFKRQTDLVDSVIGAVDTEKGRLRHLKNENDILSLNSKEILYAPGTAFGLSKKCFQDLNGFDESFHTYWEDVDFSYRALQAGFQIKSDSQFQLRHKIGKTCHKDRFYTLYLYQRNRKRFIKKNSFDSIYFRIFYCLDMIKILKKLILNLQDKEHFKLWWKAFYDKQSI